MTTITFDLDEFKNFLVQISPNGGDNGLYGVVDYKDNKKYKYGSGWKKQFSDGEIYFAHYGSRTSEGIIGKIV